VARLALKSARRSSSVTTLKGGALMDLDQAYVWITALSSPPRCDRLAGP
jgi:hypothetical protein